MGRGGVEKIFLEQRPFGATGKKVSVLGLGTVKFGRNQGVKYPEGEGFALPTDTEISSLLDVCIDHGVNLLDTAPAYGAAEERLGSIMGIRREKFFIVTKTGEEFSNGASEYVFTKDHTRMSVERSLKRLKTDVLDCVLVHSNRNDVEVIEKTDVLETLSQMKTEGKIRSFGVSTYTVEGGLLAVDRSDAVMVVYNKNDPSQKPVIVAAAKTGKAALIKKALASGHIRTLGDVGENLRFVAKTEGVTSIVFGSLRQENILSNINALLKA